VVLPREPRALGQVEEQLADVADETEAEKSVQEEYEGS
jgi:hypothetical protein